MRQRTLHRPQVSVRLAARGRPVQGSEEKVLGLRNCPFLPPSLPSKNFTLKICIFFLELFSFLRPSNRTCNLAHRSYRSPVGIVSSLAFPFFSSLRFSLFFFQPPWASAQSSACNRSPVLVP